jgi:hypothetical protein
MKRVLCFICISALLQTANAQISDSVNFNTYVSATNNDLVNKFTGSHGMVQQTTNGITGGSVLPAPSITTTNDAVFFRKYSYQSLTNYTTVSVSFKYNTASAADYAPACQIGLVVNSDSAVTLMAWVIANVYYVAGAASGVQLQITGNGLSDNSAPIHVTSGNWYKLSLKAHAVNDTYSVASAYLYDIGATGLSAPVLKLSYLNDTVFTGGVRYPKSYMVGIMNGGADGGAVYLDNWNVDGYYYTTGIEELDQQSHFSVQTLASTSLNVSCDLSSNIEYAIYSVNGSILGRGKFYKDNAIDVSNLPPAEYFIRFLSENKVVTKRFIKI